MLKDADKPELGSNKGDTQVSEIYQLFFAKSGLTEFQIEVGVHRAPINEP